MDIRHFNLLVFVWIILACLIFPILLFVTAPYGRHSSRKWGMTIPNRLGWILMELPALLLFLYYVFTGQGDKNVVIWAIVVLFCIHYVNRSIIYPLRIKTKGKQMPVLIVILAICFNAVNSYINGYYLGTIQHQYDPTWLMSPSFLAGTVIFLSGMAINIRADNKLIHLRKSKSNGYQIPYGQLFDTISCPNFFGEIIEWAGFALLCWSWPALSFFVWTLCNLVPRALDHHKWYRKKFPDYPPDRKAVFPKLL
jgi:3-oxo-5-alpha-steroid 4-dehydrogenase 1